MCGEHRSYGIKTWRDIQWGLDRGDWAEDYWSSLAVVCCKSCGMGYLDPTYTERGIVKLFEGMGTSLHSPPDWSRRQAMWLEDKPAFRILDYGCGSGVFVDCMRARGRIAHGADIDPQSRADYIGGWRETIKGDGGRYDLVTMWHVLEHMPNPRPFLEELTKCADALAIEIPVSDREQEPDLTGYLGACQHSLFMSEAVATELLRRCGWHPLEIADGSCPGAIRLWCTKATPETYPNDTISASRHLAVQAKRRRIVVADIERRLSVIHTGRFVIWGAGWHTAILAAEFPWLFAGFAEPLLVDSDEDKHDGTYRGAMIYPPRALRCLDWSRHWLILSSRKAWRDMRDTALAMHVPSDRIVPLYE